MTFTTKLRHLLLVPILALGLPSFAQTGAPAGSADPIEQYYRQSDAAFRKKDSAATIILFDRITTPTFVSISANKQSVTRDQAHAILLESFKNIDTVLQRKTELVNRDKQPGGIIVRFKRTEEYRTKDKDGKSHLVKIVSAADHTWVKVGTAYKLDRAATKEQQVTIDGTPR